MVLTLAQLLLLAPALTLANPNAVGQTPLMGWSGYNAFMQNSGHCDRAGAGGYNETTFVGSMEALVSTGLAAKGYVFLNADDCWIAENRTAEGKLTHDLSRFPHGMPWLIEQAHSRNLKLGLYAAASVETCRQYPGSQGHERVDAQTFADWKADFAKLDSCGGTLANGTESWYNQYGIWSDVMNASGRQMVFSCSWAVYFTLCAAKYPPSLWEEQCGKIPWESQYIAEKCHMWRYGADLRPVWSDEAHCTGDATPATCNKNMNGGGGGGVGDIINFASSIWASSWRSVATIGAFNDPDFLVVGCPLDRPCEGYSQKGQTPLNMVEQQTQFSMWCLLQAPLIIGSDVRTLSPAALRVLSNEDAIAINQDVAAGAQPTLLRGQVCYPSVGCPSNSSSDWVQTWYRRLSTGEIALAVVNMDNRTALDVSVPLRSLGRPHATQHSLTTGGGGATAFDVWSKKTTRYADTITLSVGPHETKLLRLQY
eukprot:COSAG01_NODE_3484_length_6019_cov_13.268750_3_plen_482_part_00